MAGLDVETRNRFPLQIIPEEMEESFAAVEDVLSAKPVLLSSPGFALADCEYYSKEDASIACAEYVWNLGRFRQTLGSLAFGARNQINIPNNSLLGTCWLFLELLAVPADVYLPAGWGYHAIESVSFLIGSQNVSTSRILGDSLFQMMIHQCDSREKATELVRAGGNQVAAPTPGTNQEAFIYIQTPFSRVYPGRGDFKKGFDSSILSSIVTITIEFRERRRWMSGLGLTDPLIGYVNQFVTNEFVMHQGNPTGPNLNLKSLMMANPERTLNYPFVHYRSGGSIPVTATLSTFNNQVSLNSFINSDLLGLLISVVRNDFLDNSGGTTQTDRGCYTELSDIELTHNSQVMYHASGFKAATVYNHLMKSGADGAALNCVTNFGAVAGRQPWQTAGGGVISAPIFIPFTREDMSVFDSHFRNTWSIPNNNLLFNFRFRDNQVVDHTMIVTQMYNAVISVQAGSVFLIT